jgi:hypothetical protein
LRLCKIYIFHWQCKFAHNVARQRCRFRNTGGQEQAGIAEFSFQPRTAGSAFKIIQIFERNILMHHNLHAGMRAQRIYAAAMLNG